MRIHVILTTIVVVNLIATGYALTVINRHQKAIETAGNAFGQVADGQCTITYTVPSGGGGALSTSEAIFWF